MKVLAVFVLALATASAVDFIVDEVAPLSTFDVFETPVPFMDIPLDEESVGRITNGQPASNGQFPYQVGLSLSGGVWCGGSLISSTHVLTAGHCVHGRNGGTAYLGSTTRTGGTSRAITAFIKHTGYNPSTIANDIAIVRISAVSMSSNIKAVKLPPRSSSYSTYTGVTVTISGWGKTSDNSGVSSRLMYAKATVISNADCAKTFKINAGNLCISTSGGRSTCSGDSGGPAVYNGQQIGITSFGAAAGCTKGYPAAFTRVTYFRNWIYSACGV